MNVSGDWRAKEICEKAECAESQMGRFKDSRYSCGSSDLLWGLHSTIQNRENGHDRGRNPYRSKFILFWGRDKKRMDRPGGDSYTDENDNSEKSAGI